MNYGGATYILDLACLVANQWSPNNQQKSQPQPEIPCSQSVAHQLSKDQHLQPEEGLQ